MSSDASATDDSSRPLPPGRSRLPIPDPRSPTGSRGLFAEIVRLQEQGARAALATPVWTRGSVPVAYQAKLLVREDGAFRGTIGGGALEAAVLRSAADVIASGAPRLIEYDLTGREAAGLGMICGGHCAILVEPVLPDRNPDIFGAAAQAEAAGKPVVLVSVLTGDFPKLALLPDNTLLGATGDSSLDDAVRALAAEARAEERPQFVEDPVPAHLDPLLPRPAAYIFGAGHIGMVLAHLTELVGFRTVVIDDREEFANRDRFPQADEVLVVSVEEAFARLPVDDKTYLIAVTRGHAHDREVVERALRTRARYLGMIGSRRKVAEMHKELAAKGFSERDLARLSAPIGLKIESETVEEIAISIVAELIAVRRGTPIVGERG